MFGILIHLSRLALVGVAAALTLIPTTARADTQTYTLSYTGGMGAYPRSAPAFDARTGTIHPEGTQIAGSCWVTGETITNVEGYTSSIWIQDTERHYWSEAWLYTGSYGIPAGLSSCDESGGSPAPSPVRAGLNRTGAATWALAHAQDPQPAYSGCAWFVSQALWTGGLAETIRWNRTDQFGAPGWLTSWQAPRLVTYLKTTYRVTTAEMNFRTRSVPRATPGDVVAYDWGGDGVIDHVAIVVSIDPRQNPRVAEWGTFDAGEVSHYRDRGWAYSEIGQMWLHQRYPGVRATLIHFS